MDNQCPLGKWLHGEGKGQYGRLGSFGQCVTKHAEFHKSAGSVARTINSGKYSEAEAMLGAGSAYVDASTAVAVAIMSLRREAGI
jgi:methyl-accepting chemotaxis protein